MKPLTDKQFREAAVYPSFAIVGSYVGYYVNGELPTFTVFKESRSSIKRRKKQAKLEQALEEVRQQFNFDGHKQT